MHETVIQMHPLTKSLLAIGLAGGGAGLGIGGHYLFREKEPKNLEEKFRKKGINVLDYTLPNETTNDNWNTKLSSYKTAEENSKFSGLTIGDESDGLKKLKDKCKEYLEKAIAEIEDGLESKVEKWCTKAIK